MRAAGLLLLCLCAMPGVGLAAPQAAESEAASQEPATQEPATQQPETQQPETQQPATQEESTAPDAATPEAEAEGEPAEDDPVADFYLSRCAGCHTVGGGYLTAPDLAPSTDWPASDLALAVERMEKNVGPLSAEQVEQLVALLKSENVRQRISAARERQVQEMAATLEPASPRRGKALFHGEEPLRKGGLACSACHRAGEPEGPKYGGSLAADLSDAYARLGESALMSASEKPGFPLMKAAYQGHPVTKQEAVHLVAYLEEISPPAAEEGDGDRGAAAPARPAAPTTPIGTWGTVLAVLVLLTLTVPLLSSRGRRRMRGRGVRAALVERARRS